MFPGLNVDTVKYTTTQCPATKGEDEVAYMWNDRSRK